MTKIRVLDLFCCAGGASKGYYDGFTAMGFKVHVVGVDIVNQPRYLYNFVQADAVEFLINYGSDFDFISASPPCQSHTSLRSVTGKQYNCFISSTRDALKVTGKPYIIENVVGSPLIKPVILCGLMFNLPMHSHRLFECSHKVQQPNHPETTLKAQKLGRPPAEGKLLARPAGRFSGVDIYREAMGLQWMNQASIAQAIPPAFTAYLAKQYSRLM